MAPKVLVCCAVYFCCKFLTKAIEAGICFGSWSVAALSVLAEKPQWRHAAQLAFSLLALSPQNGLPHCGCFPTSLTPVQILLRKHNQSCVTHGILVWPLCASSTAAG